MRAVRLGRLGGHPHDKASHRLAGHASRRKGRSRRTASKQASTFESVRVSARVRGIEERKEEERRRKEEVKSQKKWTAVRQCGVYLLAARRKTIAKRRFPVFSVGRAFGNEHPVGAHGDGSHESEPPTVTPHHLDDERSLVALGCGDEVVAGVDDAVQRCVTADRHGETTHVVIDRANHTDDAKVTHLRVGECVCE
jgi:hypothetical protein